VIEKRSLGDVLDIMGTVRSAIEGVIEGKRGLGTFARTNRDFILRSKGIECAMPAVAYR